MATVYMGGILMFPAQSSCISESTGRCDAICFYTGRCDAIPRGKSHGAMRCDGLVQKTRDDAMRWIVEI